jgi:hypothetical protein
MLLEATMPDGETVDGGRSPYPANTRMTEEVARQFRDVSVAS